VLIVEDDHDIREAVAEVLEESHYEPVEAENGAQALEKLRSGLPDPCLILLDVMMPVMDGWEFRAEQKKDPALRDIPVVLVTAHANMPNANGIAAILRKPLDFDALIRLLDRFCGPAH
jgi:CheY-like chemotaxis protein